jgi:cardiolipin synthase
MMIRHTDPAVSEALLSSFLADLNETKADTVKSINDSSILYNLDGWRSRSTYELLMDRIRSSEKVVAISPYISYPVLDAVAEVENNTVILPKNNNKSVFKLIHGMKRYSKINFKYVNGEMLHAKLMILDDDTAIYGSSNFDFVSYFFEKEVLLVNSDQHLLNRFKAIIKELLS